MGNGFTPPATTPPASHNYADSIIKEARRAHKLAGDADKSAETWAVPDGYHVEHVEQIDPSKTDPDRLRGVVHLDTLESLNTYTNVFKTSATRAYCSADFASGKVSLVVVFNDHYEGADYQDFRALYSPKSSPEWAIWAGSNGKPMQQADFAAFIENNMRDIASVPGKPTGAEMLAMALNLEITQDARFRSAVRLQSGGVQLEYVAKEDEATAKNMQVFDRFVLGLPPFLGGQAYSVEAKLRYRLQGGSCSFWYELIRPDLIVADAVKAEIAELVKATAIPVLMGRLT